MLKHRKIVLIEPRPPGYHVYSFVRLPRLGLPMLGATLKRRGCEVVEFCEDLAPIDWREVAAADLVGISTTTSTAPAAYNVARFCKSHGIPTLIGGPHVSFLPEEALQHCDYVVRGEADETIEELMDVLEAGEAPVGVRGVSYRDGEHLVHNPARPAPHDMDALPYPDLSLIRGRDRISTTPIMTSRGCPFDCSFCSVTLMFGRGFRYRSVESVMEELRLLQPRNLFFYDDIFNANARHMSSLLEAMLRENITPHWGAQCRADLVVKQKELLPLMRRSGCCVLYLGLESVNPETLAAYNKKQEVEQTIEAIQLLHQHGIMVHGMFVLGADTDDIQTIRDTVRYALRHQVDTVQFMILTPLVGTREYKRLESEGRLIEDLRDKWNLYDGHHVVFRPARLTPYQLQTETIKAMRRFYSLWQCGRMVLTPAICRPVVTAGWHALRGRWKAGWNRLVNTRPVLPSLARAYGWFHVRRWGRMNKEFLRTLVTRFSTAQSSKSM
ncbi:MAG: radical SAM protein [Armatimonadetes bacterium]|nr:radical SAM protein [Armatimonadota bacterium]